MGFIMFPIPHFYVFKELPFWPNKNLLRENLLRTEGGHIKLPLRCESQPESSPDLQLTESRITVMYNRK